METTQIKIGKGKLKRLFADTVKSAEAVSLVYVNDTEPGIYRLKDGNEFVYYQNNKKLKDAAQLDRIKKLVIPPAWEKVWICPNPNGHLQATGFDQRGRKQYKYHSLWNTLRNHTKFFHLHDFGEALPAIRKRMQKDLSKPGLSLYKVLATVVSVMQCTCIRIGNAMYEKLYGSYGLTTLKDQHVKIDGHKMHFSFKGKKGVYHNISLKSKKLASIVKQCRDIPGKELFQYYDDAGQRKSIDSGMVNDYIKEISGGNFSAKDFRTWAGSLAALQSFKEKGPALTLNQTKKNIVETLDAVAQQLGNTRTVCKKYYVHPIIIERYTDRTLNRYLKNSAPTTCPDSSDLNADEKVLMKILDKAELAIAV